MAWQSASVKPCSLLAETNCSNFPREIPVQEGWNRRILR